MSYAHDIAAILIERGLALRPAWKEKFPGAGKAGQHAAKRLSPDQLGRYPDGRFCAIVGTKESPNLSGIIDVETDGPEGEANLRAALGGQLPDHGPTMVTPSGSIHRLFAWVDPPPGYALRAGRGALGAHVDIMWQFLATDGQRRLWKGLNDPYPVITEPLWKPRHKPIARTRKERLVDPSVDEMDPPSPPAWTPAAMRRIIDQPARTSGKHLRTFQLVRVGWEAGMSRDAIWRVVANDPTCRAWVADGRDDGLLAEDVDRILRDVRWDRAEDRYRSWVELGREAGAVSAADTYAHFGRRTRDVEKAVQRAVDEGWVCCTTVRKANGAGRPGKGFVFYDPGTHRCAFGHVAGPFRRTRP